MVCSLFICGGLFNIITQEIAATFTFIARTNTYALWLQHALCSLNLSSHTLSLHVVGITVELFKVKLSRMSYVTNNSLQWKLCLGEMKKKKLPTVTPGWNGLKKLRKI